MFGLRLRDWMGTGWASASSFPRPPGPGKFWQGSRPLGQPASLPQSRVSIFFSAAYFFAEAEIIGLMICMSAE